MNAVCSIHVKKAKNSHTHTPNLFVYLNTFSLFFSRVCNVSVCVIFSSGSCLCLFVAVFFLSSLLTMRFLGLITIGISILALNEW